MAKIWISSPFAVVAVALMSCSQNDPTFGASYDACVLRHGPDDTAKEICARHFARNPTQSEASAIRSESSAEVNYDQEPNLLEKTPWDKVTASIINRSDEIVVTKVRVVATFYSDATLTKKLPDMPFTWDLNVDDGETQVVALFDRDKAPSRYYRAYVDPIKVYSHTGGG